MPIYINKSRTYTVATSSPAVIYRLYFYAGIPTFFGTVYNLRTARDMNTEQGEDHPASDEATVDGVAYWFWHGGDVTD